jgi:hypothetical protein
VQELHKTAKGYRKKMNELTSATNLQNANSTGFDLSSLRFKWIQAGRQSYVKTDVQMNDLIIAFKTLSDLARGMAVGVQQKTMNDDCWERIWNDTLAVTPMEVALEMARALASEFNKQAELIDLADRVDVCMYTKLSGNKVLAVTRFQNGSERLAGFELLYKVNPQSTQAARAIVPLSGIYF